MNYKRFRWAYKNQTKNQLSLKAIVRKQPFPNVTFDYLLLNNEALTGNLFSL